MEQQRLYVLVDENLPIGLQAAQAGHAITQWVYDNPNSSWQNDYLILLQADIHRWEKKLKYKGVNFSRFHEPDLDNRLTAVATLNPGDLFQKLKLVGSN